jgi:methylated-DNA-protein-cysteine methyltransferase-like protein
VATYGQVASLAGLAGHARQVGYALHALPDGSTLPWHRVVNAKGSISRRAVPGSELVQEQLLAREGVVLNGKGQVSLPKVRWAPRSRSKQSA